MNFLSPDIWRSLLSYTIYFKLDFYFHSPKELCWLGTVFYHTRSWKESRTYLKMMQSFVRVVTLVGKHTLFISKTYWDVTKDYDLDIHASFYSCIYYGYKIFKYWVFSTVSKILVRGNRAIENVIVVECIALQSITEAYTTYITVAHCCHNLQINKLLTEYDTAGTRICYQSLLGSFKSYTYTQHTNQ